MEEKFRTRWNVPHAVEAIELHSSSVKVSLALVAMADDRVLLPCSECC